jgi:hypothetical protein
MTDTEPKTRDLAKMAKTEKLKAARRIVDYAYQMDADWVQEAELCFKFVDNDPWPEEVKAAVGTNHPLLKYNLCRPQVRLIMGVSEQNKVTAKAIPTEGSDEFLVEILNDLADKVRSMNNFEMEEDDAFENSVICGKGWIAIDVGVDPKNPEHLKVMVKSIPWRQVKGDPDATKDDMQDYKFMTWEKWVSREDFKIQYPELADRVDELMRKSKIPHSIDIGMLAPPADIMELSDKGGDVDGYRVQADDSDWYNLQDDMLRMVHLEYWETFYRYYGINPISGKMEEFQKENLDALIARLGDAFEYESIMDKRDRWLQFIGDEIVYDGLSPVPFDGFSVVGCFGEKEKTNKRIKYRGWIKDLMDPNTEVNKRWTHAVKNMMNQTQGGNFVELGAVLNKHQFESSMKEPGATTYVREGALANGKIQPKGIPQPPIAAMEMEDRAEQMVKRIGVNPDLLAMAGERQEPGIVLQLRMKQGITMLACLFRNQRLMKKQLYERLLAIICRWMPESQMRAILGNNKRYTFQGEMIVDQEKGLQANIRDLKQLKYDVEIRESEGNITKMGYILATLFELMDRQIPVSPEVIYELMDIPVTHKIKLIEYFKQMQGQQQQMAMMQIKMQQAKDQGRLMLDAQTHKDDSAQDERDSQRDFAVAMGKLDQDNRRLVMELVDRMASQFGVGAGSQERGNGQGAQKGAMQGGAEIL